MQQAALTANAPVDTSGRQTDLTQHGLRLSAAARSLTSQVSGGLRHPNRSLSLIRSDPAPKQ
jgi:hypothetical protein